MAHSSHRAIMIPEELIGIILRFAIIGPHGGRDVTAILPCARVSREFRSEVERILYASIFLSSPRQIVQCFTTIIKRKEHAARFVRTIEIELKDYHTAFPPLPRAMSLLRPTPGIGDDGRLLSSFSTLVTTALRCVKQLQNYNLRVGRSSRAENGYIVPFLPLDVPFMLRSFGCISMDISPPIVNFLVSQPTITEFIAPDMFPPYRLDLSILPALTTVRGPPELLKRLVPHRPVTVVQCTSPLDPNSMMFILPKLSASTATIHTLTMPVANARTACDLLPFIARSLPGVESLCLPHRPSFRVRSDPYDIYKEDAFALALGTFQGLKHLEVPTMDSFILAPPPNPFAALGMNPLGAHPFLPFPPGNGDNVGGHGGGDGDDPPGPGNHGDAPGDLPVDDDDNDDVLFGDPVDVGVALDEIFGLLPGVANPNQAGPQPPAPAAPGVNPFAGLFPPGIGNGNGGIGGANPIAVGNPHVVPAPLDAAAFGNMVHQVMGMNFPGAPVAGNNHPPLQPPVADPGVAPPPGHGPHPPPQQPPPVPGAGNVAAGLPALLGNMMNNVMALLQPGVANAAPLAPVQPPAATFGPPLPPAVGAAPAQGPVPHPPNLGDIQPGPFPPDLLHHVVHQIMGIFGPHPHPHLGPAHGAPPHTAQVAHPHAPAVLPPPNNQIPPGLNNGSTYPTHAQLNNAGTPNGGPQPVPHIPPFPAFVPGGVPHAFTFNGPMFDAVLQVEHFPPANVPAPPGPNNPAAAAVGAGGGAPGGGAFGGVGQWNPAPVLPPFPALGFGGAGHPGAAGAAGMPGAAVAGGGGGGNIAHLVLTFPPIHMEPPDPNDPHVIEERRARQRALARAQMVRVPVELQILNLWQARCPSLHRVTFQMERDRYVVWTKDDAGLWISEYTPLHPEEEGKSGSS